MNVKKLALILTIVMVISFTAAAAIMGSGYSNALRTGNMEDFFKSIFENTNVNIGPRESYDIDEQESFSLEEVDSIIASTISAKVNFVPSEDNNMKLHLHGRVVTSNPDSVPALSTKLSSGKLNVEAKPSKQNISINYYSSSLKLDIYVPKAQLKEISVNTVSGNLEFGELAAQYFKYSSISGDIKGSSLVTTDTQVNTTSGNVKLDSFGGNLDFTSISGDVAVKFSQAHKNNSNINTTSGNANIADYAGDLSFQSISGDLAVSYKDYDSESIKANTTSGKVSISLPEQSGFNVKIGTTSGRINCDFPVTIQGSQSSRKLEGSVADGSGNININTISGNIDIKK